MELNFFFLYACFITHDHEQYYVIQKNGRVLVTMEFCLSPKRAVIIIIINLLFIFFFIIVKKFFGLKSIKL